MKKDWTYKKLGELTKIKTGKLDANASSEDGIYPFFTCSREPLRISSYSYDCECVLVAGNGELNVKYYSGKFDAYQRTYIIEALPDSGIMTYYMYHFFNQYVETLRQKSIGGIIKYIKLGDLTNALIPIPPLSIQRSIVSELDLLHSVIEKKQEQLRALDNLAQSLFYQMFGDPITNPMGWEIKKLGEVSLLLNGRAYQQKELLDQGKYRVLRVGNFFTNNTWYYSDLELPEDKYCDKGDLLFTWSASFGAHIWNGDKVIYHYHIWKIVLDEMYVDKLFYLHLLNNMVKSMMHDTHGTGMLHLTKSGMEMYDLPLPPLSLQQSFAAKVSAIEEQKQAITQSIKDAESLLAQRMDHYFG